MADRRHFVRSAAMTMAAAGLGLFGAAEASAREPRELAALGRASTWLNSPPLTPSRLAGHIVLVDFWTYSCINWLRTLPYIRAWARKYREGLVLIGVHTPEFGFERDVDAVRRAARQMGIDYPVVIDNDYAIWRAFGNHSWPALFFVDERGRVRRRHFGEGQYQPSEQAIQRLLTGAGVAGIPGGLVSVETSGVEAAADWNNLRSPETYLGYERTERFASPGAAGRDQRRAYRAAASLSLNQWALAGEWTMGREATVLNRAGGRLACRFHARDLHLVMGVAPQQGSPARFRVTLDGKPPGPAHGLDLDADGNGIAVEHRLYQLIRQTTRIADRHFEIEFQDSGVEVFAFTFG